MLKLLWKGMSNLIILNLCMIAFSLSPRASLRLMQSSKARAAILGRDYVTPDDVKELCIPVLNHRIIMKAEAELEGLTTTAIINRILSEVEVPM